VGVETVKISRGAAQSRISGAESGQDRGGWLWELRYQEGRHRAGFQGRRAARTEGGGYGSSDTKRGGLEQGFRGGERPEPRGVVMGVKIARGAAQSRISGAESGQNRGGWLWELR